MIIRCDCCGREIQKDAALATVFDRQVFNFCSETCRERGANLDTLEPSSSREHDTTTGHVVVEDEEEKEA